MSKKIRFILILVFTVFLIIIYNNESKAASAGISVSKSSINLGESVTITTTINAASWKISLSGAISQSYADTTDDAENGTKTYTYTFTPNAIGVYTIKLSGNATDSTASSATAVSDEETINVSQSSTGSSTSSSSSSGGTTSSGSTSGTTTSKSSNANLSNLGIRPNDFSGFKPGITTYNVTVPEDVESVEVYATASDSKATVTGTGTKTLKNGENPLNVVVKAEDGTTKTYTINVTREGEEKEEEEEQTEEASEVKNGLSNIKIADLELSPSFDTNIYEYTVKYVGEATSLDIQTVATDPNYTVEVIGNEELKEGENIITILVADAEGNNIATYQLTVNKTLVDEEAIAKEEEERKKEEQRKMFIIAGGVIALIIIIAIIIIVKRRRNRAYAEEFSGVPFAGMNDDDDYDNYDYYNDYDNNNEFQNYNNIAEETNNNLSSTENDYNVQNINSMQSEENNGGIKTLVEENTKKDIKSQPQKSGLENNKERAERERAKREFLNGYNNTVEDDYFEEEKPKRGRKKGKRFK